ncbi:MAG: EAL domain-containing protein [Mycobacteriales bacterium]
MTSTSTQRRVGALVPVPRAGSDPVGPPATGRSHPRTLGWFGTAALAMGGSNQSLFLLTALVATQGSAAVPLLAVGLLLSWAAAPGWTELVCMYPDRVGGIAATCAEAFRPYSPVLANLTGVCYWWGWVPTCGLTALLSADALHAWYLPQVPVTLLAILIVLAFTALNLSGVARTAHVVRVIAVGSAVLAFASALIPVVAGSVDWHRATTWDLTTPFSGVFGGVTSAMAGLYLIGFAAPAFEAATCHVGETRDPARNVPRAVLASGGMASIYFLVLPVVWLGVFGAGGLNDHLGADLASDLGPTFAPLLGAAGKSAAVWFMVLNMFHGTVQPLAGAARTLSQCAEDGLLPRVLERRNVQDAPWVATLLTAGFAIVFLVAGDPVWMIAAANFTYLISIGLPSVAVWLLRRNAPDRHRPWRAPRGTVALGGCAAGVWLLSTLLGFQQFRLPTVLFGLALAYSGSAAYAWRLRSDRIARGEPRSGRSLHLKLTGAMLAVMALDGVGYLVAVANVPASHKPLIAVLEDIFVAVAILTVTVGLVLPGMIAHATTQVADAARRLTGGTIADLTRAMQALGMGDLDRARARVEIEPVQVRSRDEVGAMAAAFNLMQDEVARAAQSLDGARDELRRSRTHLEHLATHDPLTDLPNRRALEGAVNRLVATCKVRRQHGAIVVIDLDGFKYVNDSRGHAVGDVVLMQVTDLLRRTLRPSDVMGRLGGDEFAVLLADTSAEEAERVVYRLLEELRSEVLLVEGGRAIRTTASIGLAVFGPDTELSGAQLLVDADVAMYDAKEAGRDRHALSSGSDPHQIELRERHTWLERIRDALEHDRFVLLGQPILDLRTGDVVRHELLLRMVAEDGALLPPGAFLGLAERAGVIGSIDRWVLRRTFAMLRCEQAKGRRPQYSVNLAGPSVGDPEILALIEAEMSTLTDPQGALLLEVTETAAVVDLDRARVFAERLHELGCRLALDDFGSGYGSFAYLKQLPFDVLKIDGQFVRGLIGSAEDQAVVTALVTIAQALGKQTVAEFVEDRATLDLLRDLGVHQAQGYVVGRPASLVSESSLQR